MRYHRDIIDEYCSMWEHYQKRGCTVIVNVSDAFYHGINANDNSDRMTFKS